MWRERQVQSVWALIVGACVWSALVWFGTQDLPLGGVARYFAPPQPDPAWFEAWFAEKLPLFNTLVRGGLAVAPWGLLMGWMGWRHASGLVPFLKSPRIFAGVLIACLLMSFPPPIAASTSGLDQSWQWFLNFAAGKCVFGSGVVFTYGPLGYLLMPQVCIANAWGALAANALFLSLWGFCLWRLFGLSEGGQKGAWLLLLTMFIPQANMEWRWVALACLIPSVVLLRRLAASAEHPCGDVVLAMWAGVVLALLSLMKFSSLVTVAGTQLFVFGAASFQSRRYRLVPGFVWLFTFALSFFLFAVLSFSSVADVVAWGIGSIRIADGYNKFFLSEKSVVQLAVAPLALVLTVFWLLWGNRAWRKALLLGVALSPMFFCSLKYSWTRQGPTAFYYLLSVAAALVAVVAPAVVCRVGTVIALLLLVSQALVLPRVLAGTVTFDFALGLNPLGLVDTVRLGQSVELAEKGTRRTTVDNALPKAWVDLIGTSRVQFLPYDFTPVMTPHDFTFCPIPVLQLYSAYLPELDALCAAVYEQSQPPDYLVVTADPMWCGYFFNHPQTWQSVRLHYEYADRHGDRILLRRRTAGHQAVSCSRKREVKVREGEWISCATWSPGVQIALQWPQTFFGRLSTTFFRNTMTYVSFKYENGDVFRFPLNPSTTRYPFLLAAIPRSADEMVIAFKGGALAMPQTMRFEAENPALYMDTLTLTLHD